MHFLLTLTHFVFDHLAMHYLYQFSLYAVVLRINIKHGKQSTLVDVGPESTIKEELDEIQGSYTGVLYRQKWWPQRHSWQEAGFCNMVDGNLLTQYDYCTTNNIHSHTRALQHK
jgi:hypothetical protein